MRRNAGDQPLLEAACKQFMSLSKARQLRAESILIRELMDFGFGSTPRCSKDSEFSEEARKESTYTKYCAIIESVLQDEDTPQQQDSLRTTTRWRSLSRAER